MNTCCVCVCNKVVVLMSLLYCFKRFMPGAAVVLFCRHHTCDHQRGRSLHNGRLRDGWSSSKHARKRSPVEVGQTASNSIVARRKYHLCRRACASQRSTDQHPTCRARQTIRVRFLSCFFIHYTHFQKHRELNFSLCGNQKKNARTCV